MKEGFLRIWCDSRAERTVYKVATGHWNWCQSRQPPRRVSQKHVDVLAGPKSGGLQAPSSWLLVRELNNSLKLVP